MTIEVTHFPIRISYKNFCSVIYEYIRTQAELDAFNAKVSRLSIDMSSIEIIELR
jgi:hypothetical protein